MKTIFEPKTDKVLLRATIQNAIGLPLPWAEINPTFVDSLLISTDSGSIYIKGEATTVVPKEEVFHLRCTGVNFDEFHTRMSKAWKPANLMSRFWGLEHTRSVKVIAGVADKAEFKATMELGPFVQAIDLSNQAHRLLVYASPFNPTTVELVQDPARIREVVTELQPSEEWILGG